MKNKVVLITGASSGLGKAIADHLHAFGYIVYGTSRKQMTPPAGWNPLVMDVTDRESVNKAVAAVLEARGRIDVLINNAGFGLAGPAEFFTEEEMHQQLETNFFGMVRVCQAVLPSMRQQKSGTIINFSSIGGIAGLPFQSFYSASKFAVEGFSEALMQEVRPFGIRVVVIEPGDFHTAFTDNRRPSSGTHTNGVYSDMFRKTSAIFESDERNGCQPEKIAKAVARILRRKSPAFRYPVGKIDQLLFVVLRHILPGNLYLKILASHYGLP